VTALRPPKRGYIIVERASFRTCLDQLATKWPKAEADVAGAIHDNSLVNTPGVAIPNLGEYSGRVFKIRVHSSDLRDGKRGGYRLIYLVSTDGLKVELITIYCKKEKEQIAATEILKLVDHHQRANQLHCVEITTEPDSAEVWFEGVLVDYAPCTLQVPLGDHAVTCKIPPNRTAKKAFTCDGLGTIELHVMIPE